MREKAEEAHHRGAVFRETARQVITSADSSRMSCKQNLYPATDWSKNSCQEVAKKLCGGGGGSRTRVRKCYWSEAYMRSRVHAPGITLGRSRPRLRTDKKPIPLACRSRPLNPDVAEKTSPLCDVLRRPTGQASENGYLRIRQRMPAVDWQLSFCTRLRVCAPRHAFWPQASPSKP